MHCSFPGSLIRGTGPVSEMIIYVFACAHLVVNGHLSLENLQLLFKEGFIQCPQPTVLVT